MEAHRPEPEEHWNNRQFDETDAQFMEDRQRIEIIINDLKEKFIPYVADKDFHGNKVENEFALKCTALCIQSQIDILSWVIQEVYISENRQCKASTKKIKELNDVILYLKDSL